MNQLLRFAVVGAIGFVVDVTVLYALLGLSLDYMTARLISFVAAAYTTWRINRRVTFNPAQNESAWIEWGRYLLAMSLGGCVNLAAYHTVMSTFAQTVFTPGLAVAIGSVCGLAVNFVTAKWWVFRH